MLFGLKNPFRGLRFGKQSNDSDKGQAEQEELQQKPAADKAQPFGNSMPWRAWTKVCHLCYGLLHAVSVVAISLLAMVFPILQLKCCGSAGMQCSFPVYISAK